MEDIGQDPAPVRQPGAPGLEDRSASKYEGFLKPVDKLAGELRKGASHLLLLLGATMVAYPVVVSSVDVRGIPISVHSSAEGVVSVVCGSVLMVAGAVIRLLKYKYELEYELQRNRMGTDLLKGQQPSAANSGHVCNRIRREGIKLCRVQV